MSKLSVGDKVILLKELHLNLGSVKHMQARYLPDSFPAGTIGEIKSLDEENLAAVDFGVCTAWVRKENLRPVKDLLEDPGTPRVVLGTLPAKSPEAQAKTPVGWIFGGNAKDNPEGAPCPNYESFWIIPDPSIPWEQEKYRAVLPAEVVVGDEWYFHGKWRKLTVAETMWLEGFPWRRMLENTPPPPGYELATQGQKRKPGYLWKRGPSSVWKRGYKENEGDTVESFAFVANPVDTGDVQKKLDLQWEAAKAVEQERNELQKKVEELRAKVDLLTETNTSLCKKIESMEDLFVEAGSLSVGKAGISVSLGDHALLSHKAPHTLYIRESAR